MKKRVLYIIALCLLSGISNFPLFAQSSNDGDFTQRQIIENMTPTPKASMLGSFGNLPVDLYTGRVNISVPIYNISINDINVPIEFKYNSSGLRYDDLPMEVGYGWTLMAGGLINYTAMGASERNPPPSTLINEGFFIKKTENIDVSALGDPISDMAKMGYVMNGEKSYWPDQYTRYADSEYDLYTFNFPGNNGSFYWPQMDNNVTGPIIVPAKPFKIDLHYQINGGNGIAITDENGIQYIFELMEMDLTYFRRNEAFYLTRIISADKADVVSFNYEKMSPSSQNAVNRPIIDRTFIFKHKETGSSFNQESNENEGDGLQFKWFYPPILRSITYRGGKIEFVYASNTIKDIKRCLTDIEIRDANNNLVKSVKLIKTDYAWLDEVQFMDSFHNKTYSYAFEYDGSPNFRGGIDYWGFFNGSTSNSYIPNFSETIPTSVGINREANYAFMSAGILKKIIYPTGGYNLLEYETHKAHNQTYGGLRIKEIETYEKDGNLSGQKWYVYDIYDYDNESGNGRSASASGVNPSDFLREYTIYERIDPDGPVAGAYITPFLWSTTYCTEYSVFPHRSYFTSGSPVVYPYVTEYIGDATGNTTGKTKYHFYDEPDIYEATFRGRHTDKPLHSYQWKNGQLLEKNIYDNNGALVYSLQNNYTYLNENSYLNFKVINQYELVGLWENIMDVYDSHPEYAEYAGLFSGGFYDYYNYYIDTGLPVLEYTQEYKDGVWRETRYSEYNQYGLPKKVTTSTSIPKKGTTSIIIADSVRVYYKYPADYTTTPYPTMVTNNRLSPIIEQITASVKGTVETETGRVKTDYIADATRTKGFILPDKTSSSYSGAASLRTDVTFNLYNNQGKLVQYTLLDGTVVSRLWSYSGQYPIAEIKGATYAQVAAALGGESAVNTLAGSLTPNMTPVNALRTSLPQALISTYTYEPLVGMKTATDPRGVITYYNYDAFGRLYQTYVIENGIRHILEENEYHYKNQQ